MNFTVINKIILITNYYYYHLPTPTEYQANNISKILKLSCSRNISFVVCVKKNNKVVFENKIWYSMYNLTLKSYNRIMHNNNNNPVTKYEIIEKQKAKNRKSNKYNNGDTSKFLSIRYNALCTIYFVMSCIVHKCPIIFFLAPRYFISVTLIVDLTKQQENTNK